MSDIDWIFEIAFAIYMYWQCGTAVSLTYFLFECKTFVKCQVHIDFIISYCDYQLHSILIIIVITGAKKWLVSKF